MERYAALSAFRHRQCYQLHHGINIWQTSQKDFHSSGCRQKYFGIALALQGCHSVPRATSRHHNGWQRLFSPATRGSLQSGGLCVCSLRNYGTSADGTSGKSPPHVDTGAVNSKVPSNERKDIQPIATPSSPNSDSSKASSTGKSSTGASRMTSLSAAYAQRLQCEAEILAYKAKLAKLESDVSLLTEKLSRLVSQGGDESRFLMEQLQQKSKAILEEAREKILKAEVPVTDQKAERAKLLEHLHLGKPFFYFDQEVMKRKKKELPAQYFEYTDNNCMELIEAKSVYLLDDSDLSDIKTIRCKSPFSSSSQNEFITIVVVEDVKKIALEKWKTWENLEKERNKRMQKAEQIVSKWWHKYLSPFKGKKEKTAWSFKETFLKDTGFVVFSSLCLNIVNLVFKFLIYMRTGSPSIYAEFLHSFGDVVNQVILARARFQSMKAPDKFHPYGYVTKTYINGIYAGGLTFVLGCCFSLHNAYQTVPDVIDQSGMAWTATCLGANFVLEGITLVMAFKQIKKEADAQNMSFMQYVKEGDNPLCNVVLLEDFVSVFGVMVCALSTSLSHIYGLVWIDKAGSVVISGMMATLAWFLVFTNTRKLVGTALPYDNDVKQFLQSDRFIQLVVDNKTLDYGDQSRFKSEVMFDARSITRHYLEQEVDMDAMLVKLNSVKTTDDLMLFLEEFGFHVYGQLVDHVDRKESDLKKRFPEIRHIDIEPS